MTYYFIGGEDHDFTKIGATSVNTATTAARRTANARCALQVGTGSASTDGWQGALSAAQSSFWFTARLYMSASTTPSSTLDGISFLGGTTRRLVLGITSSSSTLKLYKRNAAGTSTLLATASASLLTIGMVKLDVQITYGTSGSVNVYQDNTLVLSYSGDVTTDSATSLSGFVLGQPTGGGFVAWSEIICTSDDTRSMSLVTLAPSANGNAFAWTNTYANLNEVTIDDTSLCNSSTAGDLAQMTVSSSGITGNPAIRALCISARAQKGGTGPQNIEMNVRTGGNDYFSADQALPAALSRVAYTFETNPATSGPWAYTDLTAAGFNIGLKATA
jgi:hypothetical protein